MIYVYMLRYMCTLLDVSLEWYFSNVACTMLVSLSHFRTLFRTLSIFFSFLLTHSLIGTQSSKTLF